MADEERLLKEVHRAIGSDPRVDLEHIRTTIEDDGTLVLDGEVPNVAMKRLALRGAASVAELRGIVDRLRVAPAERMGDGAVRDHVAHALMNDDGLFAYEIRTRSGGRADTVRGTPANGGGIIEVAVEDGVVTLNGRVSGLESKRVAGVLAWWVPGSRDVINGLAVEPPEEDSDDALANAVRDVLERDHAVDAAHVHAGAHDGVVTLAGVLPGEEQRHMAEFDAWYVFGVDDVANEIEVHPY